MERKTRKSSTNLLPLFQKMSENKKQIKRFDSIKQKEQRLSGFQLNTDNEKVELDKKMKTSVELPSPKSIKKPIINSNQQKRKFLWKPKKKATISKEQTMNNIELFTGVSNNIKDDLNKIIQILKKEEKSGEEISLLYKYFNNGNSQFIKVLREQTNHTQELLLNLCSGMRYQHLLKNSLMFKYGDNGDNFFIILHGSVSILIPNQIMVNITEEEYLNYLITLKLKNEREAFEQTLYNKNNRSILPKEIIDNFDQYLIDNFDKNSLSFKIKENNYVDNKLLLYNIKEYLELKLRKISILGNGAIDFSNYKERSSASAIVTEDTIKDLFKEIFTIKKRECQIQGSPVSVRKSEIMKELKDNFGKKLVKKIIISKDDYITERKVSFYQQNAFINKELHKAQIIDYFYLKDLIDGEKFGDAALDKINKKRTATIITSADTHLIYIPKNVYDSFLKEAIEKSKRANISFLISSKLFDNYSKQYFQNKFFNYFDFQKCSIGEVIIEQGSKFDKLIF